MIHITDDKERLVLYSAVVILIITLISMFLVSSLLESEYISIVLAVGLITNAVVIGYYYLFYTIEPRLSFNYVRGTFARGHKKKSKKSPLKSKKISGRCFYCGKKAILGFNCSYCNNYFCEDHRLPEKHDCPFLRQ